jgi:uncharacterized protein YkwD
MNPTIIIYLLISVPIASFCQTLVDTNLSYQKMLVSEISILTPAQRDSTFLTRFNEIRAEENKQNPKLKLKPFKYSVELEKAAQYFLDNKTVFLDENDEFKVDSHADDNHDGPLARYNKLKIEYILVGCNGAPYLGVGEDLLALPFFGTVYEGCESWRSSPGHWAQIISPINTHVGFAYKKEGNYIIIVADFAKLE